MPRKTLLATVSYGVASLVLYGLLIAYSDLFVEWAERTRSGEKALFLIPVVVAFVFSYFHGAFTGHFWETLGLRAAKGSTSGAASTKH
jgi:hypothetical protein